MCTTPHCVIDVQGTTTVVLVFEDPEMSRIREAERHLREIGASAEAFKAITVKRNREMPLQPRTAAIFASTLLSALGLLACGQGVTGLKIHNRYPSTGPYMNKASAKKRNKSWAKNR